MEYRINVWATRLGEKEVANFAQAVTDRHVGEGPLTARFERQFANLVGTRHAVATPSGSAALMLAMLAIDIGHGDEVIVPAATWIATAHAASLLGAKVVLADTEPGRPVMNPDALERLLTPRTRAILPVHLGGRGADMAAILRLAEPRGIAVIEDACQALLSRQGAKALGTFGGMGCFSLGVAKLLTTGQGGMVVTDDDDMLARMKLAKLHGVRADGNWETYTRPGMNFKFTDLAAAVGLAQLQVAEERVAHVTAIHRRYADGLTGHPHIQVCQVHLEDGEVPLWTEAETTDPAGVIAHLAADGIQSRRVHPPLNRAAHLDCPAPVPHATRQAETILVLPSGPAQPLANVDIVIERLWEYRR
ncbi:DegT/DnrJ/EryC1/StrS aminotransferase family protein [Magnetospirillum sp. LM-5]|uniref:DegT/DnrJ/EryC1/StrS family aminotransferase n=1 Tax=Magnetospirillum sp. LM-5 TaxID=2681466 RepID=UPI00137CB40A|nr:DegT/DnrJ/EryC1/StrS family aminotransferase [Magnetospirillum sp. LM-5]CAA7615914.1 DegT/DnrJ/EryC1/StrS aminotransferase family protein [Magnetospirillum sp. LM-5]